MATPATEVTRRLRRVEYDQLVRLGVFANERVELLEGELAAVSPIGAPHDFSVQALTELRVLALRGRAWVGPQMSLAAHELSEPEPGFGDRTARGLSHRAAGPSADGD